MRKRERWNSRGVLWPCKDCGGEVSPVRDGVHFTWFVLDKTWRQAGMKPQGSTPLGQGEFLCIECLDVRLLARRGYGYIPEQDYEGGTNFPVSRKQWRRYLAARKKRASGG
jgi:hypothetical protein